MNEQLSINFVPEAATDDQVARLKRTLGERPWTTRKELCAALDWSERTLRNVAEVAGSDVVRGPAGFALFERATAEEIQHAANISNSQGEKMTKYGSALLKRLSERTT